ncbi:MAG: hypothetical protein H6Q66_2374 [Firmicutes bacterium]|nr:hypothetical protein [Bacillota bacterium]
MEKAEGYHRDIYSGIVANELAKEGYFGDEYRLYGLLYWIDNEKKFVTAAKEEDCARNYVNIAERGALVTPYVSYGVRVYEPEKIEETMMALKEKIYTSLDEQYGQDLEKKITEYKQITIYSDAEVVLREYYLSLGTSAKREKVQALGWLAGFAKKNRLLSQEKYNSLLSLLPKTETEAVGYFKEFSGFAWHAADGWQYYANAFLPTVVEKLIYLQKAGYLTSGIVSKKYYLGSKSVYEIKEEFQGYLNVVFDDAYLNIVRKLAE